MAMTFPLRMTDRRFQVALMAPAAIFLLLFVGYPILRLFFDSFFEVKLLKPDERVFVGLQNYVTALTSPKFQDAAIRTLVYTAITLTAELLLGFGIALLFNLLGRRSAIPRAIFIFPLMIAPIVAGLLWRFLLIDGFGIVNQLLADIGILGNPDQISWLSNKDIVLFSVALPDIWLTTCFVALITYAGLQSISPEINEAARVDGAGAWRTLRSITIPLLRPVIAVIIIIRGIDAARAFDVILIQTEGGPQSASEVLSLAIYREMIRFGNLGLASAVASLFLVGMLIFAIVVYRLLWAPARTAQ
jgi:multiple sugar transport system permease protein